MLVQREEIGERLARVLEFAQRVDDRHARVGRHLFDRRMFERAQHDNVDPALEVVRDVVERLARRQPVRRLIDKKRAAAQAVHARFKREARAQRRLFEEHHHLLAREHAAKIRRPRLEHRRQVEELLNLSRREVVHGNQIARRNRFGQHVRGKSKRLDWWLIM